MLLKRTINVNAVETETMLIEPNPESSSGNVRKGLSKFWAKINDFWNINFSCEVIIPVNKLLGNVKAKFIIIKVIRILAVLYSAAVKLFPKII